jgi:hypothetical protein
MKMPEERLTAVVKRSENRLRQIWEHRLRDNDIIVLADVRRPDLARFIRQWWPKEDIARYTAACLAKGLSPFLPYLQPDEFIEVLSSSDSAARRAAADELRGFARLHGALGIVPLFVVRRDGHWATMWAPPGVKTGVIYGDPEPDPQDN